MSEQDPLLHSLKRLHAQVQLLRDVVRKRLYGKRSSTFLRPNERHHRDGKQELANHTPKLKYGGYLRVWIQPRSPLLGQPRRSLFDQSPTIHLNHAPAPIPHLTTSPLRQVCNRTL